MIMPNWDHSPRSGRKAVILENSSPERFRKHLDKMLSIVCKKPADKRFVFLNLGMSGEKVTIWSLICNMVKDILMF